MPKNTPESRQIQARNDAQFASYARTTAARKEKSGDKGGADPAELRQAATAAQKRADAARPANHRRTGKAPPSSMLEAVEGGLREYHGRKVAPIRSLAGRFE